MKDNKKEQKPKNTKEPPEAYQGYFVVERERRKLKLSRERPAEQPFQTAGKHPLSPFALSRGFPHPLTPVFLLSSYTPFFFLPFLFLKSPKPLFVIRPASVSYRLAPSTHQSTYRKTAVLGWVGGKARLRSPVFG